MVRNWLRTLWGQIFAAQLAILAGTVAIGFAMFAHIERENLDRQYELRAAAIAATVAGVPDIEACLAAAAGLGGVCPEPVQAVASRIQAETGASYVVVIDMHRVRHSHPDPALIGRKVKEPIITADGHTHVGIDNGATGRSANGKAPMHAADGRMIGEVSVGIKESSVSAALAAELPTYAGWLAVALAAGALASWLLARRLKRRTFGLELEAIARLLQEREATLHGIREGVIAFDQHDRVSMVNDEATRLLSPVALPIGSRLEDTMPAGRLRDVLSGATAGQDEVVLTDDYCLTANRMPVILGGRPHGAVVTLRDRTEMSGLLRELDGVRSLTDTLRAQHHEFANRMHTVAGLLELGHTDQAVDYLTDLSDTAAEFADSLRARVASPLIVGLLLGKAAEAAERQAHFSVSDDTWLGEAPEKVQALTTILGNLVDNALDAVTGTGVASSAPSSPSGPATARDSPNTSQWGWVEVAVIEDADAITVRVSDTGPGIPHDALESIFVDGYTTKPETGSLHRGLGLALVHRLVHRLHGTISVTAGPHPTFTVWLPKTVAGPPLHRAADGESTWGPPTTVPVHGGTR